MKHSSQPSVSAFLAELSKRDETLADWARRKKLPMSVVYQVASGRSVGARGAARQVMKAMGIPVPPMHQQAAAPEAA